MTVYKKLQAARHELSKANLKKSGLNSFGGWKYYELGDFIPTINDAGLLSSNVFVGATNLLANLKGFEIVGKDGRGHNAGLVYKTDTGVGGQVTRRIL